ncbi:mandelate racemase [Microbotryum lychnidis-dioicae p1A1 Lamole]|uniref:Mandelate racemase n=1 Tax=Microbotryum lychnidis-dioicae (strain p1A1 Lamole / MvSl-1064) TaxID=683840 RepID=U5H1Z7_USTV1|nr:mandelate racemase [Microbotryum lychnidis-dioicae p1A1 Lamole]|eukprot:KDE08352.1 mandelate racemase [Microbotryum lychnidis-dioicae p1A1 Lamole]
MTTITGFKVEDLRFPTSLSGDGTDAMNKTCDYSAAYVTLETNGKDIGYGMTFTIGRGNDIVCSAVEQVAEKLVGKKTADLFANMGQAWSHLVADPQLRWIGPEKGVIALATAAVCNALWDMYARHERKPLWQLIADFTPEQFVSAVAFRYCTDEITPEEALEWLKKKQVGKEERIARVKKEGYPSYTTSVGWYGYSDEKVARLTREAIASGWNHFKVKVGDNVDDDLRRLALVRSIIDDPKECAGRKTPAPETIKGKNAGPTGSVLMIDANQVWDVKQAVDYCHSLAVHRPWFIEEPTAPDDVLGHASIRMQLKGVMGVATGEHAHNRMVFKQLLQAEAIDVCQIDSCRMSGVNEILMVLLMAAKRGVPVCPHAGGVGLCEYVIHLSLIDYVCVSGSIDTNVLEYVDHLHEHFTDPCTINSNGHYDVPSNPDEGYSIQIKDESKAQYIFPHGSYWSSPEAKKAHGLE